MKAALNKFKAWCLLKKGQFTTKITEIFDSPKKTFVFLALFVFTILFFIEIAIILIRNSFYNNFSDDILQYYTITVDLIAQIKAGTMSLFNLNNYFGASFFSDVYYFPLDIFTAITFILSYVVPTELAYSMTELIKIWAGVMIFAYYLQMCGMKPRTIFWMGIIYFISGGTVSFMAFPVFTSMAFYLPMGLVVIQWFFRGKKWIVPLYVLALVFYDFYLGYTAIAFVSVLYLVEAAKRPHFNLFKFLLDGAMFLGLILIGVAMSAVILYPSVLFILEDTYRPGSSFDSGWLDRLISSGFGFDNAWIVHLFGKEFKLFQPTIYLRLIAKIFVEQKPIGFYGFENHYGLEHFSLFISVIGFVYMNYIFFMKDKIAWVYKIAMLLGVIMIIFPLFSYVFSGTVDVPYTRWINMLPLVEVMILAHVFDQYGFEKVKMKWLTIPISFLLLVVSYVIYFYITKLKSDGHYVARDVMTADTVLMGVAAIILILILIFGWIKRPQWIKRLFWVEFVVALVYIYSGPFSIKNKIDTFQSMYTMNDFLNEHLDQDEFYRVFVDFERFDLEPINFNRMTSFATNTEIFHSWTDAETNGISRLLFNNEEYQSKEKIAIQSIYLNHFLGYKYVLVSSAQEFNLPEEYYTKIAYNNLYTLYEIVDSESFQVYESYMTADNFILMSEFTKQMRLISTAVIDSDRYNTDDYNILEQTSGNQVYYSAVRAYSSINNSSATEVYTAGIKDTEVRQFLMFDADQININFEAGAAYIRSTKGVSTLSSADYGEVFMVLENGNKESCEIMPDDTLTHRVKCPFGIEPVELYFEVNDQYNTVGKTEIRLEYATEGAAYLVYDLKDLESGGTMAFKMGNLDLERSFVEDEDRNRTECFNKACYTESIPKRIFLYKTGGMYETENLFALDFQYLFDDLTYFDEYAKSDLSENQVLTIEKGIIHLSYTRISDSIYDQIVMIPVAYSEEWIITSENHYDTISVSGGFLGIVIPNGVSDIDVSLKFVPKGLNQGALVSLAGLGIYALIFVPVFVFKKYRKAKKVVIQTEVIDHEEINGDSTSV